MCLNRKNLMALISLIVLNYMDFKSSIRRVHTLPWIDLRKAQSPTRPNLLMGWILGPGRKPTGLWMGAHQAQLALNNENILNNVTFSITLYLNPFLAFILG